MGQGAERKDGGGATAAAPAQPDIGPANNSGGLLAKLHRLMLVARRFDEAQIRFYKTGREKMESVHSYIGQEAIGAGAGAAMRDGDFLVPSLRSRPAFFALGVPVEVQWAGVLARVGSPGGGLIGSRHMTAHDHGIIGTTGILGAQVPVATGVAMALKARGKQGAAVCLFGDGAANIGDVHEGMNMAAVHRAPVVFICEANGVAESQEWDSYMAIPDLSVRAAGYGMPGRRIDGNDVMKVYGETEAALERARAGEGPTLIVAETCRMHPHVEGLPDFRPRELMAAWAARDPVAAAAAVLTENGYVDQARLDALTAEVDAEIDDAFERARGQGFFDERGLADAVFFNGAQ